MNGFGLPNLRLWLKLNLLSHDSPQGFHLWREGGQSDFCRQKSLALVNKQFTSISTPQRWRASASSNSTSGNKKSCLSHLFTCPSVHQSQTSHWLRARSSSAASPEYGSRIIPPADHSHEKLTGIIRVKWLWFRITPQSQENSQGIIFVK